MSYDSHGVYEKDWTPKWKTLWVYEIMQRKGGLRRFYFSNTRTLNRFRNLTREHSSEHIMPDSSSVVNLRESCFSKRVDLNDPYTHPCTSLKYYGCKDDYAFQRNQEYWKKCAENLEQKRLEGTTPPDYVNMTDWVKMSKKEKKEITNAYKLKRQGK